MSNGPGNYFYRSGAGSGSGSGFGAINYITNFGAETDTTGWATYADAAGNIPVDGTGGSATNLTFSRSASTPLIGTGQFSLVQANSTSLQGKGVAYAFTIDPAFQSTNLAIQFSYNASSTFVTGDGITAPLNDGTVTTNAGNSDIEIFVYDVTNSILIPVSPQVMTGKGSQNYQFKGTFQTASNSTSYRLIFHVATASANATGWTYLFDNVFVGPQAQIAGSPESDWVSFTPTGSWVANSTYTGYWRRIGSNMEVQVNIALAGAPTTASLTVNMPTGYTIDTTRLTNSTASVGTFLSSASGKSAGANAELLIKYSSTSAISVFYQSSILAAETAVDATHPGTFANGDAVNLLWTAPIVGWGSTTTMSNDSETRVVAMFATGSSASLNYNAGTPNSTIPTVAGQMVFGTVVSDSHGAYNSTTGVYTIPVAGYYAISASYIGSGSTTHLNDQFVIEVFNSTTSAILVKFLQPMGGVITTGITASVNIPSVYLTAGTAIYVRGTNTSTTTPVYLSNATLNYFSVARVSGPAAIAATDTVAAAYTDTAGSAIATSFGKYAYATKVFDTHGAYGNSGIYTVPISGKYLINAILGTANTTLLTSTSFQMAVFQNNTQKFADSVIGNGAAGTFCINAMGLLSCTAGDTLAIQVKQNNIGSSAINAAGINYFSINRIGN